MMAHPMVPLPLLGPCRTTYSERLFMLEREGKQGLGTAYILGFKWAIEKNYDFIFEMDADFSHNPRISCTAQSLSERR